MADTFKDLQKLDRCHLPLYISPSLPALSDASTDSYFPSLPQSLSPLLYSQLVKHVREMEDFETASKQDRVKLLSGNSRALIEEEKFRKNGKRKYEQITERIIAMAELLEQLTATAGASSPGGSTGGSTGGGFNDATTTSIPSSSTSSSSTCQLQLDIGPLDLSSLSSQSQSVLKGKVQWQEKLELMHLHTTTHGTRR